MLRVITSKGDRKILRLRRKLRKFAEILENVYRYRIFITLTFAEDVTDDAAATLLKNYFQWLRDNGYDFKYFWVKERTKRGRIHYHVILFSDTYIPKPDASGWKGGMSNVQLVRKGVYAYMAKYLSKSSIPGRMYGYSRGILNDYNKIPMWLWDKGYAYARHLGVYFLIKSESCWGFLKWRYACGAILLEGFGTVEFLLEWFPPDECIKGGRVIT